MAYVARECITSNFFCEQKWLTKLTEASAVIARTSAQETMPGQAFSTAVLMLSTTSNPRAEFLFGTASFSL